MISLPSAADRAFSSRSVATGFCRNPNIESNKNPQNIYTKGCVVSTIVLSRVYVNPKRKPAIKAKRWLLSRRKLRKLRIMRLPKTKAIPANLRAWVLSERKTIPNAVDTTADQEIKIKEKLMLLTLKLCR